MPRFQEVVNLDADALREATEYLQMQYRKPHESEAHAYGAFYAIEFSVGVYPYELNLC